MHQRPSVKQKQQNSRVQPTQSRLRPRPGEKKSSGKPIFAIVVLAFLAIAIVLASVFLVRPRASIVETKSIDLTNQETITTENAQKTSISESQVREEAIPYSPAVLDWDKIPTPGHTVTSFSFVEGATKLPAPTDEQKSNLSQALSMLTNEGIDVGFAFLDLNTGSGYAYNIDELIFGASSFKGPVGVFACQERIDKGELSINSVRGSMEQAICSSDDDAYHIMRRAAAGYGQEMIDWLASMNIDEYVCTDTSFPRYTARDSIKLWTNAYLYFNQETEAGLWLKDLMSRTGLSFMRNAIDPSGKTDATVYDKSGYINDTGYY